MQYGIVIITRSSLNCCLRKYLHSCNNPDRMAQRLRTILDAIRSSQVSQNPIEKLVLQADKSTIRRSTRQLLVWFRIDSWYCRYATYDVKTLNNTRVQQPQTDVFIPSIMIDRHSSLIIVCLLLQIGASSKTKNTSNIRKYYFFPSAECGMNNYYGWT